MCVAFDSFCHLLFSSLFFDTIFAGGEKNKGIVGRRFLNRSLIDKGGKKRGKGSVILTPSLFFPRKKGKDRSNTQDFFSSLRWKDYFFLRAYATLPLFSSRQQKRGKNGSRFRCIFFAGNGRMSPQQARFCALDRKSLPLSKFGKCFFEAPKKCQFRAKELVQSSYTISRNIFYSYSVLLFPSRRQNLERMGGWYIAA